ncbi:hypothetical protein B0H15DRAFT_797876 [Mycena belliarum]|uniref:Uncharacterized protein n=1 Tax=Mycena belliarum TaxID=1033014 RepID=A0AAD6UFH7_9AGAR|nr:hypothetical protein B0H15DRAFT_797876 [Mycena belliae]
MSFAQVLTLVAIAAKVVSAVPAPALLTVAVPFGSNDSETLTAHVIGVNSAATRTTYALEQNAMDGTSVLASATGTLVEGADYASYTYAISASGLNIAVGFDCALQSGNAICSDQGATATFALSTVQPWVLDVVATSAPAPGSSGSAQAKSTASTQAQPTGSTKPNSAPRTAGSVVAILAGVALAYQLAL